MGYSRALRHASALAAIAGLTLPADAKVGRSYTEAEKAASLDAWHACLFKQAAAIDDGTSPADAVGRIIAPICRAEADAAYETFGPFRSERSRLMFVEMQRETEWEVAAEIVLRHRARKKVG